jgi:hypothetical protein
MKIKSANGEVEAEKGMLVNVGHSHMKPGQRRFTAAKIIDCDGDEFIQVEHDFGFNWVHSELCELFA